MDPQVVPFVKEEIIRNVIKAHESVLITGWQRSGKSVSALKAAMSIADTYYFDPMAKLPMKEIEVRSASTDLNAFVSSIQINSEVYSVLVVDNYEKLGAVDTQFLKSMLKGKRVNLKLLVISGAFANVSAMIEGIEAVIRLKKDTAELVYSIRINQ